MAISIIPAWTATVFLLCSTSALSQTSADWRDIRNANELRTLLANKTFKGKDYLDRPMTEHLGADGTGLRTGFDGTRVPTTWTIKGSDQVCITLPWDTPCYRVQQHQTQAGRYRFLQVGNDSITDLTE